MKSDVWVEVDDEGYIRRSSVEGAELFGLLCGSVSDARGWLSTRADVTRALRARVGAFHVCAGPYGQRRGWRLTLGPGESDDVVLFTFEPEAAPADHRDEQARCVLKRHQTVGRMVMDPDGMIVVANEAASELLCMPMEQLVGASARDIVGPFQTIDEVRADREAIANRRPLVGTMRVRRGDGSEARMERLAVPMTDDEGRYVGLAISFRDVTVAYEVNYLMSLDRAVAGAARVVADVAHGVNNVAARIQAAADRAMLSDRPDSAGIALETITELTQQLGELGAEMLWMATPGAVGGPTDLGDVARQLARLVGRVAGHGDVRVRAYGIDGLMVAAARDVLVRSALHFALRAVDTVRSSRGTVCIEALAVDGGAALRIRWPTSRAEARLLRAILDPDRGMRPELSAGFTDGLRWRFTDLSGEVAVDLVGPLAAVPRKRVSGNTSATGGSVGRLLVADDEEDLRSLYADALETQFAGVAQAVDGQDAWEQLVAADGCFSLVILDLRMPRLDGLDLLERVRDRWPELRVLVASGAAPDGGQSVMALGARAVLTKPFSVQQLRATVRAVLAESD